MIPSVELLKALGRRRKMESGRRSTRVLNKELRLGNTEKLAVAGVLVPGAGGHFELNFQRFHVTELTPRNRESVITGAQTEE